MPLSIDRIDHVVINCRDVHTTATWYERVLGMRREAFGSDGRLALKFGAQKFNLRPTGAPDWETGVVETPGALDLCLITPSKPDEVVAHLKSCGVAITTGPVDRLGALGTMTSVYCRDPDGNLVEIASYPG
jgi:catechol 2,3-dioxygenase-like lactoylglutathione lyase family enzyme